MNPFAMFRPASRAFLCCLVLASLSIANAQSYQGADAAIRAMKGPAKEAPKNPLADKFLEFRRASTSMPPEKAATDWLRLAKEAFRAASTRTNDSSNVASADIALSSLPGPDAWPSLYRMTHAAKPKTVADAALRLVTSALTANPSAQVDDMLLLYGLSSASLQTGNGVSLIRLTLQLRDAKRLSQAISIRLKPTRSTPKPDFEVPNLEPIFGAATTKSLVTQVLLQSKGQLVWSGAKTKEIARKAALENLDKLKRPVWSLATGAEGNVLRLAMEKKFHAKAPAFKAAGPSVIALVVAGKQAEAVKAILTQRPDSSYEGHDQSWRDPLVKAGKLKDFRNAIRSALLQKPASDWWGVYVTFSASLGMTSEVPGDIRAALASPKQTAAGRSLLRALLPDALLADDQVEAGLKELRIMQNTPEASGAWDPQAIPLRIGRIGQLLNRKDLIDEGVKGVLGAHVSPGNIPSQPADFLLNVGRGPDAEKMMIEALRPSEDNPAYGGSYNFRGETGAAALSQLVKIYDRAGRSEEIVKLLDRADWPAPDLVMLTDSGVDGPSGPMATQAAKALAAVGRNAEALKVATASLARNPADDPTFEIYTNLRGLAAIPDLDRMYDVDRFEERPLIWKAVLLKKAGRLDEAEKTIRQAISVDPSDGETKFGHRMFGYAVLADILEAKGDTSDAQIYRNAVKAIRMSEKADDLVEVGLVQRGIHLYAESLNTFADAYCIQSRLAIQLAENGKPEEATEHYRRAFELMPDSFGRVESHCFGCEGAFEGEQAQKIAEQVLEKLSREQPKKAQVPYLLGYLREAQDKPIQALSAYRQAVALDPDYLNAWIHILDVSKNSPGASADYKAAQAAIIHLDPLSRHSQYELSQEAVTDYRAQWLALASALPKLLPIPEPTFPLQTTDGQPSLRMREMYGILLWSGGEWDMQGRRITSPSQIIARKGILASIGQTLQFSMYEDSNALGD